MKRKTTPIQNLWILFGLQVTALIFLVAAFAWLQPRFYQLANQAQQRDAKYTLLMVQTINQAPPEKLHKDILTLLYMHENDSEFIQVMEINSMKILGSLCFSFFVLTGGLGVCVYQVQRQDRLLDYSLPPA